MTKWHNNLEEFKYHISSAVGWFGGITVEKKVTLDQVVVSSTPGWVAIK